MIASGAGSPARTVASTNAPPPTGEVEDERGRDRVEPLGVVEPEHEPAPTGALAQRLGAAAHQLERVVRAHVVGDQLREGAERDGGGAARRLHPGDRRAGGLRLRERLAREARLADPGVGDHDDAAHAGVGARRGDRLQLGVAADQRPGGRRRWDALLHGWSLCPAAGRGSATLRDVDLIERLLAIDVSALSDADKTLPVADPGVRAMIPGVRMAGPAFTVVAEDDHLPVMSALAEAAPGDVLVIATGGDDVAVFGELFATEARRRGLAGIVADGLCRDLRGLREIGLPVFARGTTPRSGTTAVARARPARRSTAAASASRPATSCSATTTAC